MRIWLIGADQKGTAALRQMEKNPNIEMIVSDAIEQPRAVTDKVIAKVDYVESVTPININTLARRTRPDLILIDTGAIERNYGRLAGGLVFSDALNNEIATASDYPCLIL
jgi:FlaA1/EpsC-like NDP-sugar epimerase